MQKIIDISRLLSAETAVWPGDTPYTLKTVLDRADGHTVNLTTLTISAHTATHMDAPRHFTDDGLTIEQMDLHPFWGNAQVVTVAAEDRALVPSDFAHVDLTLAPRLLIRSQASTVDHATFFDTLVYPSPELADFLRDQGIILFGNDGPSVDAVDSKEMAGHHALLHNNIDIVEGLDLSNAPDGLYEFVALPLKIKGGDGSPVRAALKPL